MFYVLDENKNLVEALDREGVLALLEQAIEDGSLENIDENSAVASKLKSLVNGTAYHIEFITQAQFNALRQGGELVPNTYYHITDDTTAEDLNEVIQNIISGQTAVGRAQQINNVRIEEENGVIKHGNYIISQKKLLWSGQLNVGTQSYSEISFAEDLAGKSLEIEFCYDPFGVFSSDVETLMRKVEKIKVKTHDSTISGVDDIPLQAFFTNNNGVPRVFPLDLQVDHDEVCTKLYFIFDRHGLFSLPSGYYAQILAIWEVIE